MAGGKLSARQKMINLMYLVFIAMLALNMSKEVLSAFGSINEKLGRANTSFESKNNLALADLKKKSSENEEFAKAATTAQQAADLSKTFYDFLEVEKEAIYKGNNIKADKRQDYESMDKTQFTGERYTKGDKLSKEGQGFINQMDQYRNGMIALIGDNNPDLASQIKSDFSTCLLYTSPSPRDQRGSRMLSSA